MQQSGSHGLQQPCDSFRGRYISFGRSSYITQLLKGWLASTTQASFSIVCRDGVKSINRLPVNVVEVRMRHRLLGLPQN